MRFKEFITELFDPKQAAEITWVVNGFAKAYIDKRPLSIVFEPSDNGAVGIEFSVEDTYKITGGGKVSAVFATVIEAVKQFVEKNSKVDSIYFTAHEQSRAKMYDTLSKRVARDLGWHVVPYDEMMADKKYNEEDHDGFVFAIEKGPAPKHRQSAQRPQHGDFKPIFYVTSLEAPELPVIKIKTKRGNFAEEWVLRNIPEYKDQHPMALFARKAPPPERKIIDVGEIEEPKKNEPKDPNSIAGKLQAKLDGGGSVSENFADGKKPGRKGLAKRSGVNTKASVSSLRKTAKNSSGEKQRMAHWLANMKAGRAKKNK
jgi:hypothetical protein